VQSLAPKHSRRGGEDLSLAAGRMEGLLPIL